MPGQIQITLRHHDRKVERCCCAVAEWPQYLFRNIMPIIMKMLEHFKDFFILDSNSPMFLTVYL